MLPFWFWGGLDSRLCGERGRGETGEGGFRRCHVSTDHESKVALVVQSLDFAVMLIVMLRGGFTESVNVQCVPY